MRIVDVKVLKQPFGMVNDVLLKVILFTYQFGEGK